MTVKAIDSHVHIWNRDRDESFVAEKVFPVLTGKSFMPDDLRHVLDATHAEQAVLVHGPASTEHTHYCLDLCAKEDVFLSVIGWVDLRSPFVLNQLNKQASNRFFKGIRLTPLLDEDPASYLQSTAVQDVGKALSEQGNVLEVLAPHPLLGSIEKLARELPDLNIVIAHFGLPSGVAADVSNWVNHLSFLRETPNVHVKVSGLPLVGDHKNDVELTQLHFGHLLDLCGPERLHYASNWPVATALASPKHWRDVLDQVLAALRLGDDAIERVFYKNSYELYAPLERTP